MLRRQDFREQESSISWNIRIFFRGRLFFIFNFLFIYQLLFFLSLSIKVAYIYDSQNDSERDCWYIYIHNHSCDFFKNVSIKLMKTTAELKFDAQQKTVRSWLWVSGWTHGLKAQLVGTFEQNSVVVSSNPTQINFL